MTLFIHLRIINSIPSLFDLLDTFFQAQGCRGLNDFELTLEIVLYK